MTRLSLLSLAILLAGCATTVEVVTNTAPDCYQYERLRDYYEEAYGEEPPDVMTGAYLRCRKQKNPFAIKEGSGGYVMNYVRAYDIMRYSFTDTDWPHQYCEFKVTQGQFVYQLDEIGVEGNTGYIVAMFDNSNRLKLYGMVDEIGKPYLTELLKFSGDLPF